MGGVLLFGVAAILGSVAAWLAGWAPVGVFAALLGGVALLYRPELPRRLVAWLTKRDDLPLTADSDVRDYLGQGTARLEIEGSASPDDYPAVPRADPDNETARPSRRRASSILARATTRMILAAQSAYMSGCTGVAFAGQTINLTLLCRYHHTHFLQKAGPAD